MKICFCFGTRPEIIKLAMLIEKSREHFEVSTIFTSQHTSLFEDVKDLIATPSYSLEMPEHRNLNVLASSIISQIDGILRLRKPDWLVVQGDTTSAMCAAYAAFQLGIKVGHVEAGLRTFNILSPFPEEFNRQCISRMATYNWCPTERAASYLEEENISGRIIVTGNPIVDYVKKLVEPVDEEDLVIITLHRRENADKFSDMLEQINEVAKAHPHLQFIFPAHPNPIIQDKLGTLNHQIKIVKPMKYLPFLNLLSRCKFIITDSGGIQEEAVCLKKKVLICRDTTERMEGVEIGLCKLVGSDILSNIEWALKSVEGEVINPYGDGNACEKIISSLIES